MIQKILIAVASLCLAAQAFAAPAHVLIRVPAGTPQPAELAPLLAQWKKSGRISGVVLLTQGKPEKPGDKAIFERVKPMLEKLGNQIYYAGPLGAGHAIKALNNYVSAAGLIAACEAMHAGAAFGIDPNVVVDIINTSSGMNNTTKNKCKQYMISGTFNAGFSTGLMAKDVRTALEIAQAMNTSTILAKPTADIWDDMEKKLGFLSDHTEMHKFTNKIK